MKTRKLLKRKTLGLSCTDLPTSILYSIKFKVKITFTSTSGELNFLEKLENFQTVK